MIRYRRGFYFDLEKAWTIRNFCDLLDLLFCNLEKESRLLELLLLNIVTE